MHACLMQDDPTVRLDRDPQDPRRTRRFHPDELPKPQPKPQPPPQPARRGPARRAARGVAQWVEHAFGGPARTRVIVVLGAVLALASADTATVGASATSLRSALHVSNADIG